MKILALGAHPDDIEIFMFGLLMNFKKRGDQVSMIVATDGSLGGSVEEKDLSKKRSSETIMGLKKIGKPILLNFPDGHLGENIDHKTILKDNILSLSPDLLLTHSIMDYHSDHRILSRLVGEIASHYIPVLYCDSLLGVNFIPNYFVEITEFFELKKKAILEHKTQNPNRFVELVKLMNGYRAAQCNSPLGTYAEAYSFDPSFPFADIRNILPPSPQLRKFQISDVNGFL